MLYYTFVQLQPGHITTL